MEQKKKKILLVSFPFLLLIFSVILQASALAANTKKVLVVMSYHLGNTWQDQQREGIEAILSDADIKYYYLDTKRNKDGASARAKEAYALYQNFKPDAVIAADDHAQSYFVVPYLKDKVKTPVVFLGVNNDASKYGFPATNVTGILEVKHVMEGISFAKFIEKDLKKVAVLYTINRSNTLNVAQIKKEQASYPAEVVNYYGFSTLAEAMETVAKPGSEVDAFFSLNLTGLLDENGKPIEATTTMRKLTLLSQKPIIAADSYDIEAGALCGVIKTGQEQGETAARMVRELLQGKDIRDIPITKNKNGKRYINVTTADRLGIVVPHAAFIGTKLVR